jgi:hypothetical protein
MELFQEWLAPDPIEKKQRISLGSFHADGAIHRGAGEQG